MRTIWIILIVGILIAGCNEAQRQPKVWGQGELPMEWQGFFGKDNNARLDFFQSRILDQQSAIIHGANVKSPDGQMVHKQGLIERVMALEVENPAELAERVRKLEDAVKKRDIAEND